MTTITAAKNIITEELGTSGVHPLKILLFGSRARANPRADSDWDFYIVVDKEHPYAKRRETVSRIRTRLALAGIVADVFVHTEQFVAQRKNNTGYLTYYALKDGVPI